MRIGHLELFVRNPLESKDFYVEVLGFRHVATQGNRVVWVAQDDQEILLRPGSPPAGRDRYTDAGWAIVLYTDDVDAWARRLRASGLDLHEDEGVGCFTFQDPDGHWFQLVDPDQHG